MANAASASDHRAAVLDQAGAERRQRAAGALDRHLDLRRLAGDRRAQVVQRQRARRAVGVGDRRLQRAQDQRRDVAAVGAARDRPLVGDRGAARRRRRPAATAVSRSKAVSGRRRSPRAPVSLVVAAALAPDLDAHLVDGQRDRRLGLGGLDPHLVGGVLVQQAVGDGRAQALQRLVGALLGDERDGVADLAVVDGVLDHVGDGRVAVADLQADVEHQALADLALGGASRRGACRATGRGPRWSPRSGRPRPRRSPRRLRRRRARGRRLVPGQAPSRCNVALATFSAWRACGDVVDPEDACPALQREDVGGDRPGHAVVRVGHVGELVDEGLARDADHDAEAERDDLVGAGAAARGCAPASCRSRCRDRRRCGPRGRPRARRTRRGR